MTFAELALLAQDAKDRAAGVVQDRPRAGDWGLTSSGRRFWPADPRVDDICIEDIAHALSMQCRFGGHAQKFYCPTPSQRVLTADLRWVPAGDLSVGDELVWFDENLVQLGSAGNKRRRFRHSVVTHAEPVRRAVIRLEMEDGSTVDASDEHPWLVATKASKNQKWEPTCAIAEAISQGRSRHMHRFCPTWRTDESRLAGWLAGIYDGEGYLSATNRNGCQMGVSQKRGLVLDAITSAHLAGGFKNLSYSQTGNSRDVVSLQVLGGWREIMRLLGTYRPIRLLDTFVRHLRAGMFDKQMNGSSIPLRIVGAHRLGDQWCSGLETSTHTYLCEGYGAHNSVAQHSVLVARLCSPENRLVGLLHDATEAYLQDIIRPLKRELRATYKPLETAWAHAIGLVFGLGDRLADLPEEVHAADRAVLVAEHRDLMAPCPDWPVGESTLAPIEPWGPAVAKDEFWRAFRLYSGARA